MPHFLEAPKTHNGTRVIFDASPAGLVVRSRATDGSETSSLMPADVALKMLDEADHLRIQLVGTGTSLPTGWGTWTWFTIALVTATTAFGVLWECLR